MDQQKKRLKEFQDGYRLGTKNTYGKAVQSIQSIKGIGPKRKAEFIEKFNSLMGVSE
jgi:excinuclease UvrABC nuclease subunit